jgi:hypothetical protein
MRIAGVRVSPPYVRMLAQLLESSGSAGTAATLEDAIRLQVLEPSLTYEDHDAILLALGDNCPAGLARLRRELLDDQLERRRLGL